MNLNGAHLHLLLNHLSLFALLIGSVVLATSMKRKSPELRVLATVLFVVTGVFAWVAVETGEKAEKIVKQLGEASDPFIEQHELAADWALRSGILVAVLALGTEWAVRRRPKWFRPLQWALLLFALHGFTVFAATAYLGGMIRHTEVRGPATP